MKNEVRDKEDALQRLQTRYNELEEKNNKSERTVESYR